MSLSICIPVYNNDATLPRVLAALRAQVLHNDEVLVINDGSRDRSAAHARAVGGAFGTRLRVLSFPHRGAAAARNEGIRAATNELLLFLGADMLPGPTLLQRHRAVHRRFPERTIGCLGHVTWDQSLPPSPFMVWLEQGTQNGYGALAGRSWVDPRRYAYGANLSLKRSLAVQAGGYDAERFHGYGWEDVEFGLRLSVLNFRLFYEPTAQARHVHRHTIKSFLLRQRAAGRALVVLQALHPQSAAWSPKVSTARWRARRVLYPRPLRFLAVACASFVSRRWILSKLYAVISGWAFTDGVQEQRMGVRVGVERLPRQGLSPDDAGNGHYSAFNGQKVSREHVGPRKILENLPHTIHRLVHKE